MYISGYFEGTDGVNLFYRRWIPKNPLALMVLVYGAGEHSGRLRCIFFFSFTQT